MGMSLSTDPSIHRCGEGFHGAVFPVLGSLASKVAEEKITGTEQEAALELLAGYPEEETVLLTRLTI